MLCRLCLDRQVTDRERQEPPNACDPCLAAIGEIRVWFRESGKADSLERAVELRKFEIRSGKELVKR